MKHHGLLKLPADERDFKAHKVFGSPLPASLPPAYLVAQPVEIANQDINYDSDFCASYAAAAVAEDEQSKDFVPEWTFAQGKKKQWQDNPDKTPEEVIALYGLDLRTICQAACSAGFLERTHDPYQCNTPDRPARDIIADWRNWADDLAMFGFENKQATFFDVLSGPYDVFDNFRTNMLANKASILTGTDWRQSWTNAPGGMLPDTIDPNEAASGHAIKIAGWKEINGLPYLIAQLSDGPTIGDRGLYYFSRALANQVFGPYGAFSFSQLSRSVAEYHLAINLPLTATLLQKTWSVCTYVISQFLSK